MIEPDHIRRAVRDGRISPEHGAKLIALHYEIARSCARRERRIMWRAIGRELTRPWRWLWGVLQ